MHKMSHLVKNVGARFFESGPCPTCQLSSTYTYCYFTIKFMYGMIEDFMVEDKYYRTILYVRKSFF